MDTSALGIDDQLFMIGELERLKRENEDMLLVIDRLEREKELFRNKAGKTLIRTYAL